jgi:hypothetical protein
MLNNWNLKVNFIEFSEYISKQFLADYRNALEMYQKGRDDNSNNSKLGPEHDKACSAGRFR